MNRLVRPNTIPAARDTIQESSSDAPIQLGSDLWFDTATATIFRLDQEISLTAREVGLLTLLLRMPGRFHSASTLARLLKRRQAPLITAHSIEQTICGLRKKLGERGQTSQVLRSHRGLGYGVFLFPEEIPHYSVSILEEGKPEESTRSPRMLKII